MKDESIMIGDDVEVTVVDIKGGKVRLGIIAPKSVPVHRLEVYKAIKREKGEANVEKKSAFSPYELT
jgi:carbon storage regulator